MLRALELLFWIPNILEIKNRFLVELGPSVKSPACVDSLDLLFVCLHECLISPVKHDMRYAHQALYCTYDIWGDQIQAYEIQDEKFFVE